MSLIWKLHFRRSTGTSAADVTQFSISWSLAAGFFLHLPESKYDGCLGVKVSGTAFTSRLPQISHAIFTFTSMLTFSSSPLSRRLDAINRQVRELDNRRSEFCQQMASRVAESRALAMVNCDKLLVMRTSRSNYQMADVYQMLIRCTSSEWRGVFNSLKPGLDKSFEMLMVLCAIVFAFMSIDDVTANLAGHGRDLDEPRKLRNPQGYRHYCVRGQPNHEQEAQARIRHGTGKGQTQSQGQGKSKGKSLTALPMTLESQSRGFIFVVYQRNHMPNVPFDKYTNELIQREAHLYTALARFYVANPGEVTEACHPTVPSCLTWRADGSLVQSSGSIPNSWLGISSILLFLWQSTATCH
jgi:hypothetical protein